jgi:hypothetical protein
MPLTPPMGGPLVGNPPMAQPTVRPTTPAPVEIMWAALRDAPLPELAVVMAWLTRHPEFAALAASGARVSPTPGQMP